MKKLNFFKKMIGVIVKSTNKTKETTPQFSNNKYEFGDPKDFRMVLFTADGDAYESKDIIFT